MLENKIAPSANRDFLKKVGWGTMTALALLLFLVASRYLSLNPTVYFEEQKAVYIAHTTGILTHVIGAMLAIIIGPFQFLPQSITRRYDLSCEVVDRAQLQSFVILFLIATYAVSL